MAEAVLETVAWRVSETANVGNYSKLHVWRPDGSRALCGARGNWVIGDFGHSHSGPCKTCFAIVKRDGLRTDLDDDE